MVENENNIPTLAHKMAMVDSRILETMSDFVFKIYSTEDNKVVHQMGEGLYFLALIQKLLVHSTTGNI